MTLTSRILILLLTILSPVFGCVPSQDPKAKESVRGSQSGKPASPEQRTSISASRIRSQPLVEILNYARVQELNSESGNHKQDLRLRLYAIPKEGDCIQDSHYVCSHHYYLAVSTYEEGLGETVYDLGEVGEISGIEWLKSDRQLKARLRIIVSNYPSHCFNLSNTLIKKQKTYELLISLDNLSLTPAK